ncbi:ABC1 family-domain-containing protein [Suillus clintonianus]|uniref:ABC1 family-domain-containing protein n=1 Tax=Suillus clintonianus TaxID=1904413 RepID=UPI001B863B50|nr:ABC1 family-domain-containing protein [Suillus clintonianus]KAG2121618.1 ABC1 family-domain-containing protein [Suillus clintonianus]
MLPRLSRSRLVKRTAYTTFGLGAAYLADTELNASAVTRNLRTLWTCALISADYKLNFTPEHADRIPALHQRVADRMYDLFTSNGGLYIKIGQAIGANAALMPAPFQQKFARLFDDAPQIPYPTIARVFQREFNKSPQELFAYFDEKAMASASVAQVHKARTWDGDWVAVKVQKPDVGRQTSYDLVAFRAVMWAFEKWVFDLPVYFAVDFISTHLRAELDFIAEASNAQRTASLIASEPRLAGKVYIPKVYPEYSTKRVLTAEWIDGVRLSDREALGRVVGEKLPERSGGMFADTVHEEKKNGIPESMHNVKLKGGMQAIMHTMVELFSAQMFDWGFVHCDPHPGNVIIRARPGSSPSSKPVLRDPQLVLLDHGLYVTIRPSVKRQYASLWRALLTSDWDTIRNVTESWGVGEAGLFASAVLMRPVKVGRANGSSSHAEKANGGAGAELNAYEQSVRMKERLKRFLVDTDKMPKELIFLGRNMRIVQGNNQSLGSPVNRIKITAYWASRSLVTTHEGIPSSSRTWWARLDTRELWRDVLFRSAMFSLDVVFWVSKLRQRVRALLGFTNGGFEDELERSMRGFAKSTFGVEMGPGAFEG